MGLELQITFAGHAHVWHHTTHSVHTSWAHHIFRSTNHWASIITITSLSERKLGLPKIFENIALFIKLPFMGMQVSGPIQPLVSIGPGHHNSSAPQVAGQLEGHSVTPSNPMGPLDGTHRSGIMQPSASIPPGQLNSSAPHSTGAISGQAEAAAAKRVKVMKAFMVKAWMQLRCCCIFQESFYT